ncbi:MAG: respiratory nitrate reductase subunit gamma [Nitrospira sp.]|nr:respiratory nitrate reductase subunit gamma [Nitrospira sp.]
MINTILFGTMPYIFLTICIVGLIYRYRSNRYSWSSQSSEFLENAVLFYGSFPWHYGIITILLVHIFGLLFPSGILAWNSVPVRLYILELSGLSLGLLAFFGLLVFTYRRLTDNRVKAVTTGWDVLTLIVLLIQVATGLGNAILYRWGSNWYAATAVPWMWSIFTLQPDPNYVSGLRLITKVHIFNAMIFIGLMPFTRLAHFVVIRPYQYLWRPYQQVRWYRRGAAENIVQPK